jgi:hypothetical protein
MFKRVNKFKKTGMKRLLTQLILIRKIVIVIFVISFFSCSDDNNTVSDKAELTGFTVSTSAGFTPVKTFIDSGKAEVHVFTSGDLNKLTFPLTLKTEIEVSEGATVEPASGANVTFKDPEDFVKLKVTSEDGSNSLEYIFTIRDKQIPNAGFENWFQETGMNSQPFQQPGKYKESTVWATANMGTSIYSIYGTTALKENNNTSIKIETVSTIGMPLIAGALYIGEFDINSAMKDPTNPVAAAKLGIPFYERPKSVKFKYKYKAGAQLIQAVPKQPGNLFGGFDIFILEGKDKFGMEIALEKREGENVTVIAKTNFQSDQDIDNLTEKILPLNYLSTETPTHFYISFSPSFDGGTFKGAVGSTLTIDDLEIIYD